MINTIDNRAMRWASVTASSAVVGVSALVLAGYAADVDRLRNGLVGGVAVRPNAAVALFCLAAALLVRNAAAARVLGAIAMAIGGVTALGWATGTRFRVETLLFGGADAAMPMSIPAAAATFLGGAAVLVPRPHWLRETLGAATGFIGALTVVAHLYDARLLPAAAATPAAFSTAILLVLWAAAYLLAMSGSGPLAIFRGRDEWSSFARRTAAVTLTAPVILGALSLMIARTGVYDEAFAAALIVTTTTFTLFVASVHLIARIRRSEALYRTIVESAHDGIVLIGLDMRVQIVNDRLAAMLGYRADELRGRTVGALIAGDEMPQLLERSGRRNEDGQPTQTELRLRRRDGSELPVISAASRVIDPDGRTTRTVIILTDIADRVRAEEARRISEARFRRLYDANAVGVAFWDDDGVVHEANDELLRIFGVARDELPGWRWSEHNTPEGDVADRKAIEEVRSAGRAARFEKECIRRDGTHIWVQVAAAELDRGGNIAFVSDITARVEATRALERAHDILAARVAMLEGVQTVDVAQERAQVEVLARRLAAANEELETFSYSVSHDLRAPLRAIDGFSRELMLNLASQLDSESQRYLSRIRAATQRMAQLIDDLLDLSRLSRRPMNRAAVDVSALAADVAGELGAPHVEIEPRLTAFADPHLLRVVLQNLIDNAVKFSARREQPRVEVFAAGDGAIAVRDNGVGFDMQFASKIFAPFQRLHPATQFEGTGIGLALVQRIVARHGGSIRAESAPGNGATFYLTLGDPPS